MKNIFEKINQLSEMRVQEYKTNNTEWYKGNKTFQKALLEEIQEAYDEIKTNNSVYLEDELGDVFWTYITLLNSLKDEGLIDSTESVMNRCFAKFSGRIEYLHKNTDCEKPWAEIKAIQKIQRKKEHEEKYNQ